MQLTPLNKIFRHFFPRVKGAAMVIPEARARLQSALSDLVTGRITTWEFDKLHRHEMKCSPDRAVAEIADFGWSLYSDLLPYRITKHYSIKPEIRSIAERCLLFLQTDLEYGWPKAPELFWKEMTVSLAIGMLLGGVALLVLAVVQVAEGVFWLYGLTGILSFPLSIWLLVWIRNKDCKLKQEFWASGDRDAWPFLNRREFSNALEAMSAMRP